MKKRILKVVFFFLTIVSIIVIYYYIFKKFGIAIPCLFHKITGLHCPGCGLTRMLIALWKGNIKEAFMYNQLLFILLPFFLIDVIYSIYLYITAKEDQIRKRIPKYVPTILMIVLLIWGVIRNLSIFPYLRP